MCYRNNLDDFLGLLKHLMIFHMTIIAKSSLHRAMHDYDIVNVIHVRSFDLDIKRIT